MDKKSIIEIIKSYSNDLINEKQLNGSNLIEEIISDGKSASLLSLFKEAIQHKREEQLFNILDEIQLNSVKEKDNILLPRCLSLTAHFIDIKAESILNGAKYDSFDEFDDILLNNTIKCFELNELECGVNQLINLRKVTESSCKKVSDLYDSCVQILIKSCVKSAMNNIFTQEKSVDNESSEWVVASAPARIDLQGGWTDTPPICYELGGKVINMAIKVNGSKPIGAKVRRIKDTKIIRIKEFGLGDNLLVDLTLNSINDLKDFHVPNSPGALIKAALICTGIIKIENTNQCLSDQLNSLTKSGLEIHIWSDLPQGSGLGTSSILAGCVVSVLWTVSGQSFSKSSLIHAVLYLEQLLTTGGGWQDQVGGAYGGINLGSSINSLPLKVNNKPLNIGSKFQSVFDEHLILVYTGTVRLAKNLLQTVIRNWYIHEKTVIDCFQELKQNAEKSATAFMNEDLHQIGALLSRYWQQKKVLASGCEPDCVAKLFEAVEPYLYGGSLTGAGGGGFMCLILKDVKFKDQVIDLIHKYLSEPKIYDCHIDNTGIEVFVGQDQVHIPLE